MPAPIMTVVKSPLSEIEIVEQLRELRKHSLVESSHFAVASIFEIILTNGSYAYVSGVNIENHEHNRMSSHSEQNAMATAQTLLGGNVKFSKAWVMGAPDQIHQDSTHFLAHNHVSPCGHCRQILLSLSEDNAVIYSVTVNGNIAKPDTLTHLLPSAFSERDLGESASQAVSSNIVSLNTSVMYSSRQYEAPRLLQYVGEKLSDDKIFHFLQCTKPHVINESHKTSPIDVCILQVSAEGQIYYIPGALVQDAAFLTTDAIFAAIGMATTKFGKNMKVEEIYLYTRSLELSQFSATELEHLTRFTKGNDVLVTAFKSEHEVSTFMLSESVQARCDLLMRQLCVKSPVAKIRGFAE